jgi:hypothetical protein
LRTPDIGTIYKNSTGTGLRLAGEYLRVAPIMLVTSKVVKRKIYRVTIDKIDDNAGGSGREPAKR